jgi:hypothetical protein
VCEEEEKTANGEFAVFEEGTAKFGQICGQISHLAKEMNNFLLFLDEGSRRHGLKSAI